MDQTFCSKRGTILFRITLVPINYFEISHVHHDNNIFFEQFPKTSMILKDGQTQQICLPSFIRQKGEKTLLPYGASMLKISDDGQQMFKHDVTQDGIIHMIFKNYNKEVNAIFAEWVISCLAFAMTSAHSARLVGKCLDCEYILSVGIRKTLNKNAQLDRFKLYLFDPLGFSLPLCAYVGPEPLSLSEYKIGAEHTFHRSLQTIINDLYTTCGEPQPNHFTIDPLIL